MPRTRQNPVLIPFDQFLREGLGVRLQIAFDGHVHPDSVQTTSKAYKGMTTGVCLAERQKEPTEKHE